MAGVAILPGPDALGTMSVMEEDTEATQLMLEALFDIKVAVFDVKEFLMGDDDGSEEEEEEEDS